MARKVDEQRRHERRIAITDAAAELFARHGFEKTSTAAIARAAGISTGSLFYYFTDKSAVFRGIFERDIPDSEALFTEHAGTDDPLTSIRSVVDTLATPARAELAHGLLVELLRRVDKDEQLAEVVAANESIVHAGITALLREAAAAGQIDPELDAGAAATWIRTIIDAAYLNAETDPLPMLQLIITRFIGGTS